MEVIHRAVSKDNTTRTFDNLGGRPVVLSGGFAAAVQPWPAINVMRLTSITRVQPNTPTSTNQHPNSHSQHLGTCKNRSTWFRGYGEKPYHCWLRTTYL